MRNKKIIISIALVSILLITSGCSLGLTKNPTVKSAAPSTAVTSFLRTTAKIATPTPTVKTTTPVIAPTQILTPAPTPVPDTPVYVAPVPTPQPVTGGISGYGDISPNDPAMRLAVPNIRQDWEPWKYQIYANTSSPIEMMGCALTSLSMILRYYGLDTDPGELNNWMNANGGFVGYGAIIWSKAIGRVPGLAIIGSYSYPNGADLAYIKNVIDRGFPVMAEVNYLGTSHYVVLTGYNDTTFYVNDPWYENPGHTLDRTVMQGNKAVAYDANGSAASTIKSVIVFATSSPVPNRVRMIDVQPAFVPDPTGYPMPIQMPRIQFTAGSASMIVNGNSVALEVAPVMSGGTLLVPLGALMSAMGGKSSFDASASKITASVQNRNLEIWSGIRTAYNNGWFFDQFVPPQAVGGEMLVSAEALSYQLGCHFSWDPVSKIVVLTE